MRNSGVQVGQAAALPQHGLTGGQVVISRLAASISQVLGFLSYDKLIQVLVA